MYGVSCCGWLGKGIKVHPCDPILNLLLSMKLSVLQFPAHGVFYSSALFCASNEWPAPRAQIFCNSREPNKLKWFFWLSKVTHYLLYVDMYPLHAMKFLIPKSHNSQTPSKASRFLRVCCKSITGEGLLSCKVWAFIWFGSSWAPCKILTQRISKMSKILPGLIFPIVNLVDLREDRFKKHWGFFSY